MWKQDYTVTPPVVTPPDTSPPPITDKSIGTIVPLYTYPNHSSWVQIAGIAKRYPRVHVVATINPNSGVGSAQNPDYVNGIRFLTSNNITVLGYVSTRYGGRSESEVKAEIDRYKQWYPELRGIFFDEMANQPGKEQYYANLNKHAKSKEGFVFTVGNPGAPQIESYFRDTGVDNIHIFENVGYPAVAVLKQSWAGKYPRSRFGVIPYGVDNDITRARNFTSLVVGAEKIAGYVYLQTDSGSNPWDSLSPLFETTIQELDRIAALEGTVTPAPPTEPTEPTPGPEVPEPTPGIDKFGVKMIYPTDTRNDKSAPWFVNMEDPRSTVRFKNLPELTKESDGSFSASGGSKGQVRLEAWSEDNKKWLNVEITGYSKLVKGSPTYAVQQYSRGGHHSSSRQCEGSAMKGRFYRDGRVAVTKEVNHPAYCGNRGVEQASTKSLSNRWQGQKTVIYNIKGSDGKTYVLVEVWIDDDVTDSNGNLVVRNNWKKVTTVQDRGGWSTGNDDFETGCPRMDKDRNSGNRERDEILSMPGGTTMSNLAAWRTDGSTNRWKYLSVREIIPPSVD